VSVVYGTTVDVAGAAIRNFSNPPIVVTAFYTRLLQKSIETRLLDCEDADVAQWACVLDQKHWPGDLCDLTFGEVEVRNVQKAPAVKKRHDLSLP